MRPLLLRVLLLLTLTTHQFSCATHLPTSGFLWVRGGVNGFNKVEEQEQENGIEGYSNACEKAIRQVVSEAENQLMVHIQDVDNLKKVDNLGIKVDSIIEQTLSQFKSKIPEAKTPSQQKIIKTKVKKLAQILEPLIQLLQMKQIILLRDEALEQFIKEGSPFSNGEGEPIGEEGGSLTDFEKMVAIDSNFGIEAQASMRKAPGSSNYDFSNERKQLLSLMNDIAKTRKKGSEFSKQFMKKEEEITKMITQQRETIENLHKKAFGFASPLSSSFTYRIPESSLLVNVKQQYGRTDVELSSLPDPKLSMLGPRGFVKGIGPMNLGLSVTISM